MEHQKTHSKALKWSLIIGITIVLNLFFNYTISLIYPAPDYSAFCPTSQVDNPPETKDSCIAVGGQWTENTFPEIQTVPATATSDTSETVTSKQITVSGSCDATYSCSQKFDTANDSYERTVFVSLVVLGIISILLGLLLRIPDPVTVGLSLGGVLSLIIASMRYWSEAGNFLKVVILFAALIALIWVGVKKFQD
jgi:hypothetical protein